MRAAGSQRAADRRVANASHLLDFAQSLAAFVDCRLNFSEVVSHEAKLYQVIRSPVKQFVAEICKGSA
jgi:hypothetical protein